MSFVEIAMNTSDEYSDEALSSFSGNLDTSTSFQELFQASISISTPRQHSGSHHQENRQNTNYRTNCNELKAALASTLEDETPLRGSNLPPLLIPTPSTRSEHFYVPPKIETLNIPRPYSDTFNSTCQLTQQLSPLSCVFKREWFRTCDRATGTTDIIAIIRQCLDSDKVKRRKPMELESIMDSAKLNKDQQGKVLEVRRKLMRQKNSRFKRESLKTDLKFGNICCE